MIPESMRFILGGHYGNDRTTGWRVHSAGTLLAVARHSGGTAGSCDQYSRSCLFYSQFAAARGFYLPWHHLAP